MTPKKNKIFYYLLLILSVSAILAFTFVIFRENFQKHVEQGQPQEKIIVLDEKKIMSSESVFTTESKSIMPFDNGNSYRGIAPLSDNADFEALQRHAHSLLYGPEDEKITAIKLLSDIGTREQKDAIKEYAKNNSESTAVRLTAIEYMDWNEDLDFINHTLSGNDGISEAIILMASIKELSPESRSWFEETIYSAFLQTQRPSTQIAILDYFYEQHSNKFDDLASIINLDEYSPEERHDALNLMNKRSEDLANEN